MNWHKFITVLTVIGLLMPLTVHSALAAIQSDGAMGCHARPLSDFLEAQGSTTIFFPPVEDMMAYTSAAPPNALPANFAVVDYMGFADAYIAETTGRSLGTAVTGTVLECPQQGGGANISVVLETRKALGFAQSVSALDDNNYDFLNTPTFFGSKAQDVVNGAPAAVGPASLRVTFYIHEIGGELPDIRIAFQDEIATYAPITLDFRSTTVGMLSDGTHSRLRIQQVGAAAIGDDALTFTREIVDVIQEK